MLEKRNENFASAVVAATYSRRFGGDILLTSGPGDAGRGPKLWHAFVLCPPRTSALVEAPPLLCTDNFSGAPLLRRLRLATLRLSLWSVEEDGREGSDSSRHNRGERIQMKVFTSLPTPPSECQSSPQSQRRQSTLSHALVTPAVKFARIPNGVRFLPLATLSVQPFSRIPFFFSGGSRKSTL